MDIIAAIYLTVSVLILVVQTANMSSIKEDIKLLPPNARFLLSAMLVFTALFWPILIVYYLMRGKK